MDREAAVEELKRTYTVLVSDLDEIVAYGKTNPSEFAHRTLVRTHFAFVEGLVFQLQHVAVASSEPFGLFSFAERSLLGGEQYTLSETGEPRVRNLQVPLLPSIRFAIDCYARIHGAEFKPNYGGEG